MINTGKFMGKTVFITGASRGIGKEIALKLAKDGANIVVAAKTASAHPKLPGTIFTAAEEIVKAGGNALPCIVDVRDEESVKDSVEEAVKKFGGIDILINNASAISLTGTEKTDMKRYDLMHSINTRGTFLMTKTCLPYLKRGKNPHVLNMSPPLAMETRWFSNHVAYTMAKFGMSMCVLGHHEEFRPFGIAVNALWPLTSIWTAAQEMLTNNEGNEGSRKPSIMADAAYAVLSKDSKEYTGNFLIDEDVLRAEGVTDFEQYASVPGTPLLPDFFLPEGVYDSLFPCGKENSNKFSKFSVDEDIKMVFEKTQAMLNEDVVQKIGKIYHFVLESPGENGKTQSRIIKLDLKNGSGSISDGSVDDKPNVVLALDSKDFAPMFTGRLRPTNALMTNRLKISGDIRAAMVLETLLRKFTSAK